MTKYSSRFKRPNSYLRDLGEHWKERRRRMKTKEVLPSRRSGNCINECWKPSNEASKEDLREYHREEMKLRRSRRSRR
jgi:hypothetical protein